MWRFNRDRSGSGKERSSFMKHLRGVVLMNFGRSITERKQNKKWWEFWK